MTPQKCPFINGSGHGERFVHYVAFVLHIYIQRDGDTATVWKREGESERDRERERE